jgi:hypothetical protein
VVGMIFCDLVTGGSGVCVYYCRTFYKVAGVKVSPKIREFEFVLRLCCRQRRKGGKCALFQRVPARPARAWGSAVRAQ